MSPILLLLPMEHIFHARIPFIFFALNNDKIASHVPYPSLSPRPWVHIAQACHCQPALSLWVICSMGVRQINMQLLDTLRP